MTGAVRRRRRSSTATFASVARTYSITRNAENRVTKIIDANYPGGRTWNYGYTGYVDTGTTLANHKQTSYTDPEGKVTSYDYGNGLDLQRITDARGNRIKLTYDYAGPNANARVASIQRLTNTRLGQPRRPEDHLQLRHRQ